jgi:hypothetical protein
MSRRSTFTGLFLALGVVALLSALAATPAVSSDSTIPSDVQVGIEGVLKKKAAELLSQKNSAGFATKRGTYSKSFRKAGPSTYIATFHIDTVEPSAHDPKTDVLKTERFELTVTGDAASGWKIGKEELKDTSASLYRGWFGGGEIYRFDKLSFEREGIKVSATNGMLWMNVREGKQQGASIFATDLAYEYGPPADTGYYEAVKRRIVKAHPEDLFFKPERLSLACDPTSCQDLFAKIFTGLTKIGESGGPTSGIAKTFAEALDKDLKEADKNRKENPFSGFWLLPEPDRRYWTFLFARGGKDSNGREGYVLLNYDNWEPWEVRFYASRYGGFYFLGPYGANLGTPLFAYYDQDTRKSAIPAADLERRDDIDGRDYDLNTVNGTVDLALDESLAVEGDVTFGITIKRELSSLPFGIARANTATDVQDAKNPRLFVNTIQDGNGKDLTWVRRGLFDGMVIFPKPLQAGEKITLRMKFTNLDSIRKVNPSFSALDRGGWLPFVRFADFIDTFDLTVRTPEKFTVLGIGKKISDDVADNVRTTRWTAEQPVSFPTVIFGEYLSAVSDHIVKKSDGTPIPVTVYVDKVSTHALDTKILDTQQGTQGEAQELRAAGATGARDIRGKQLGPIAVQAAVAIDLYQKIYGVDYPFAKLDLVADPLGSFYGQAPSSIIYLGFGVFRGEGTVAAGGMFEGGSNIARFNKDVVAHETGHQWWGSVVANSNQRNYWFIESLAEVSSALYVESVFGKKKYLEKVAIWRDTVMKRDQLTSVQNNYTVWAGEDGFGSVQSNIYDKGPYAFHIFRSTFGDEKFFALMKALAQELQHQQIVTRDIQDVMEKVVGGNMDWFFDQWIRGIGRPQYALYWTKRKNEQGKWIVEGTVKQRVVYGKFRDEMPGVFYRGVAPLTFVDLNGKETKATKPILVQGAETPFRVIVGEEPEQVFFNKDGEILAEDLLVNRSW